MLGGDLLPVPDLDFRPEGDLELKRLVLGDLVLDLFLDCNDLIGDLETKRLGGDLELKFLGGDRELYRLGGDRDPTILTGDLLTGDLEVFRLGDLLSNVCSKGDRDL